MLSTVKFFSTKTHPQHANGLYNVKGVAFTIGVYGFMDVDRITCKVHSHQACGSYVQLEMPT